MAERGPHWTQHPQRPLSFLIGSSLPNKTGRLLGTVLMRPGEWAWGWSLRLAVPPTVTCGL